MAQVLSSNQCTSSVTHTSPDPKEKVELSLHVPKGELVNNYTLGTIVHNFIRSLRPLLFTISPLFGWTDRLNGRV